VLRLGAQVRCSTLVIQGSQDAVVGPARGAAVAEAIPHAQLITLDGCGHAPHLRDPVITNLLIRDVPGPDSTSATVLASRRSAARTCDTHGGGPPAQGMAPICRHRLPPACQPPAARRRSRHLA
jgi:hypothetical protein